MKKNAQRVIKWGLPLLILFVFIRYILYANLNPTFTEDDLIIEQGRLELNESGHATHKEYVMELTFIKKKEGHTMIYPYSRDLNVMTFSKEDKGYYLPSSIGSDGQTENMALDELRKYGLLENNESLVGLWLPDEAGTYNVRLYFNGPIKEKVEVPKLITVSVEERFGKDLSWVKLLDIDQTIQIESQYDVQYIYQSDKEKIYFEPSNIADSDGQILYIDLVNEGNSQVLTGEYYHVEVFKKDKWISVPFKENIAFNSIGYIIEPNLTKDFKIHLNLLKHKLKKGLYRIVKRVWMNETEIYLGYDFNIK